MQGTALKQLADRITEATSSNSIKNLVRGMRNLGDAISSYDSMVNAPDPYKSDAANEKAKANMANKLREQHAKVERKFYNDVDELEQNLNGEISVKADLKPKVTDSETRSVLRSMNSQDRMHAIRSAAQRGDSSVMSAIACCNSLLTGLPDDARNEALEIHKRKSAPQETAELEQCREVLNAGSVALSAAARAINQSVNTDKLLTANKLASQHKEQFEKFQVATTD